jgi:outer membrane protein assembly factor BamB
VLYPIKRTVILLLPILIAVPQACSQAGDHSNLLAGAVDSEESFFASMETNRQWPSYRGYFACGFLDGAHLPDSFNVASGYHVAWETEIPGLGLSCPVIWDDRVFVTTAISQQDSQGFRTGMYGDIEPVSDSSEHVWKLYCIHKNNGEILWEKELHRGIPSVKRHPKSSHASTTVATDGTRVVVFLGSEGLYCYNVEGDLIWKRDFGLIRSAWNVVEDAEWEFGSSPIIFRDRVVIQADALNTAFVAVLDLFTGETIWRRERDEISDWCTPNIYFNGTKPRVVVNGYNHRGGYVLETGEEVWKMSGGGDIPIPTPVVWKDLIYFNSAHGRHFPLMAIRNSASGTIPYPENDSVPDEHIAWFYDRGGAYMSSVLVYDSILYRLRWNGNLTCFDARDGTVIYQQTVHPASFIASPVAADGKIYMVSEEGVVYIARAGREYDLLASIPLGEVSLVTPGITGGMIIFRTAGRLIAVSSRMLE